jgi:hypothetical protein
VGTVYQHTRHSDAPHFPKICDFAAPLCEEGFVGLPMFGDRKVMRQLLSLKTTLACTELSLERLKNFPEEDIHSTHLR